jgi:hypothetical protein
MGTIDCRRVDRKQKHDRNADDGEGETVKTSPTCPVCGDNVSEVQQLPDHTELRPCGHSVAGTSFKSWRNKGATVDYVSEDIAAREEVDATPAPQTVSCDEGCGALLEPATLEEYKAALQHWMSHSSLGGCSQGR